MNDKKFSVVFQEGELLVRFLESHMKGVAPDNEPWRSIEESLKLLPVTTLVLDLGHVEFMTSHVLGKIVGLKRKFAGEITLANLSPSLYEIFLVTKLGNLFVLTTPC